MASVREALGKFSLAPTIDFDSPSNIDIPLPATEPVARPQVAVDPNYNPFHTRGAIYPDKAPSNWETLYEGVQTASLTDRIADRIQTDLVTDRFADSIQTDLVEAKAIDADSGPMWQYANKYILMPMAEGLLLINQHRAHQAVLYRQFIDQLSLSQGAMQQLLFPEVLALPQDEMVLIAQLSDDLRAIGFDIEQLSPDSYSILGVPAQLADQSPVPVLQHILVQVRERGADTQREWREQIALTLAQSAAIPYGKTLTEAEMRDLVTRLIALPNYGRTADGKVIVSLLSDEEINKRF